MKKIYSFILLAVMLVSLNIDSIAQVTIPAANTNGASNRKPYGSFFGFERSDVIYTAAEIGTFGNITAVGFYVNSVSSPAASTPVVIKMKTTTATTITSSTYAAASTGATTVWTGNITSAMLVAGNWVTVVLDVPFSYTADNLEVLIEANATGGGNEGSTAKQFRFSAPVPAATRFQSWQADTSPPTGTGTTSSTRANVQLTLAPAVNCSVAITNLNPVGTISPGCSPVTVAPKAKISNNGSLNQTAMSVRYRVVSLGYDETVSGLSVNSLANIDVDFPNTLVLSSASPGNKAVIIDVSATCDGGAVSYTLNTSFDVSAANVNFGGPDGGGYYWSNSTSGASCSPNQPIYYWEDTTGSTSMVLNGANQLGALMVGTSTDDAFFTLGGILAPGDKFRYYGIDYDSFYVGTNGFIAFSKAFNTDAQFNAFTPLAINSAAAPRPAVFPFWKDFNYTDVDVPVNRLSYKVVPGKLIITYDRAPNFNTATDATDYASFQIIIETSSAPIADGLFVSQYNDAETGASFLTKYNNGTLATHTVGIQNSLGTIATQYRRANPVVGGPLFSSPVAVAFGTNQGVLPVELASFTASTNNNEVTLNWSTATESNNSGFDIERSASNGVWSRVGNVAGNGTTVSPMNYSFTDRNVASGSYSYRLKQIDFNGNFEYFNLSNEVNVGIPTKFDLSQNYPNPFNPSTSINYEIPFDGKVSLKIFDMAGKEVATLVNEVKTAGYYTYNFNASNLSSGVYFYSLSANNFTATKKMMLLK